MVAVLKCLEVFRNKARSGRYVVDSDCVATGISLVHWQQLRTLLVENNWIAVTESGHYVLCRDLATATIWDIAVMVQLPVTEPVPAESVTMPAWHENYRQRLTRGKNVMRGEFETTLEAFYDA